MKDDRMIELQPNRARKGRQLVGLLAGNATDEEIEEFSQHIMQIIEQSEREEAQKQGNKPRRKRAKGEDKEG